MTSCLHRHLHPERSQGRVHEAGVDTEIPRDELSENEDLWTDQAGGKQGFEHDVRFRDAVVTL